MVGVRVVGQIKKNFRPNITHRIFLIEVVYLFITTSSTVLEVHQRKTKLIVVFSLLELTNISLNIVNHSFDVLFYSILFFALMSL
jgi:hypothetical protein